jgi:hypothetical protein
MCPFTVTWDPLQLHYMSLRSHCHSLVSRSQAYITHGHHSFVTIYLSFLTGRQATFRTLRGKRCSTSETCIYAIKFSNHFVATMGPSLRKRISKLTTEPPEDKVSSIASSSSIFLAAVDHLRTPNTLSKDNMASTPPPTPPRKPEKLRCSPSKSLLHRYKGRAANGDASSASLSSKKVATTSPIPNGVTTRSRSRIPSFTENFEHSKSAVELTSPSRVASASSVTSTIRTISGVDIEMMTPSRPSPGLPIRSKSVEPTRMRFLEEDDGVGDSLLYRRKRETRSETRAVRSDSTIGDLDGTATKLQKPSPEPASPSKVSPHAQATLKKKNNDPLTVSRPKIPRVDRNTAADSSRNITPTKSSIRSVDSSSDSSDSDDSSCEFILEHGDGIPRNSPQDPEQEIRPTTVLPPLYIPSVLPGLLWASPMSGSSRPDRPWQWCKRWTCCRCSATTIVEQRVCAKLTCGHHRCGDKCKLSKVKRLYLM